MTGPDPAGKPLETAEGLAAHLNAEHPLFGWAASDGLEYLQECHQAAHARIPSR